MKYSGHKKIYNAMKEILEARMGAKVYQYAFPPPIFHEMEGEYRELDLENGKMIVRFPFFDRYYNPYGVMQGGMIAAAVDNTIGPLSVLVAPPNVTRKLELTYSKPVDPAMGFIDVEAVFKGQDGQRLNFTFAVRGPDGSRLVRGKSLNWIIEE